MCLNRHYVAEGVRLYSQSTWQSALGAEARGIVETRLASLVEYFSEVSNQNLNVFGCIERKNDWKNQSKTIFSKTYQKPIENQSKTIYQNLSKPIKNPIDQNPSQQSIEND